MVMNLAPITLTSYFSLPANMYIGSKKETKSGIPRAKYIKYTNKPHLSETHIKYKPQAKIWDDYLKSNDEKVVYILCDALTPHLPRYVGETRTPLKRIKQHMTEAVILNHPSKKCQWIRQCSVNGTQVLLRPLMIIPNKQRIMYEKVARCLLNQFNYSLFNPAKTSNGIISILETTEIPKRKISSFFLEIILTNTPTDEVSNKLIDSIK